MEKIKRFIEANIDGCSCNLECSYCYLRQKNYNQGRKETILKYPLDVISKACSVERLGGKCLFSIVGDGETLLPEEVIDLIMVLIEEGHFVSVLTNGTVTKRIHELIERLEKIEKKEALNFHISLHYPELKRKNLLSVFFENVKYIQLHNMSFNIKTVLGEEFDENLADELKTICVKEVGAFPQIGLARRDKSDGTFSICTKLSKEDYYRLGDSFHSQLFELDSKEFNYRRDEFCYAGEWSFMLNFTTGRCWECLSNNLNAFNFFEHVDKKLPLKAVGMHCNRKYCSCVNFQAWGIMPGHEEYSNLDIYDRPEGNWIKEPFRTIFDTKLYETNKIYDEKEKAELLKWQTKKEKRRQDKLQIMRKLSNVKQAMRLHVLNNKYK